MPLSPNSDPSLISQVREILSDSRNDYLKRQQLFQDNEQAQARIGLGYAQLAAQRENQALDADLKMASLQQSAASDYARLSQLQNNANIEQARANYTLNKDAAKQDLDERKFEFDKEKEKREKHSWDTFSCCCCCIDDDAGAGAKSAVTSIHGRNNPRHEPKRRTKK
jgi:hypothetical protein